MKTLALSVALLTLLPSAMSGADEVTKTFTEHFHDDANIPTYVALVDDLIVAGELKIYASMEDEKKDSNSARAKTPNGILMLYTVTHTPDGVLVHFSTSRAPYLPTALGKHVVGLFMARSGWPKPTVFNVSENQVFHAIWLVPDTEFAKVQTAFSELRGKIKKSEDPKAAFLRGLLRAGELKEEPKPIAPINGLK